MDTLRVATYNIHKGFSHFNLRVALHDLKEQLHLLRPDVLFLQEVLGQHRRHAIRHANWPEEPQYQFLAGATFSDVAYGRNAIYPAGHHGNAILSRHPILSAENEDVSAHQVEQRGLLHCEIAPPGWPVPIHCINVHLGLFAHWRRQQIDALVRRIQRMVPEDAPLIIAGDFNDWRGEVCHVLSQRLHLREAFTHHSGAPARSFPAVLPMFRLDRIYVRGLSVQQTEVHHGFPWSRISDHAALSATLVRHA